MFKFKKIISLCLIFIMLFSLSTSAFAAGSTNDSLKKMPPIDVQELNDYGLDGELLMKVLEVAPHIVFSDDGTTLATDLSDDTLLDEFNFTDKQLVDFKAILDGTYQPPSAQNSSIPRIPLDTYQSQGQDESPIVSKAAARFYLSNYDLTAGVFAVLGTAASVGPAALIYGGMDRSFHCSCRPIRNSSRTFHSNFRWCVFYRSCTKDYRSACTG